MRCVRSSKDRLSSRPCKWRCADAEVTEFVWVALGGLRVESDLFERGLDQSPAFGDARPEPVHFEAFLDNLGHRDPWRQAIGVGETANDLRQFRGAGLCPQPRRPGRLEFVARLCYCSKQ